MPISLMSGRVETPEFSSNMNAFYRIEIEAKTQAGIQSDTVECLLGAAFKESECARKSVLRAAWVLTNEGKIVEQGSSDDKYCCLNIFSNGVVAEQIGSFHNERGRRYGFQINFLEDGSALAAADPHLKIEEGGDLAETGSVVEGLLLLPCGTASLFGIYLLVSAVVRHSKSKSKQHQTVARKA